MSDFNIIAYDKGETARAAAHIKYRGYIISLSTIPNSPEIGIWKEGESSMEVIHDVSMESILLAKEYVDNQIDHPSRAIHEEPSDVEHQDWLSKISNPEN